MEHRPQWTDIDADLHRRSDGEKIDQFLLTIGRAKGRAVVGDAFRLDQDAAEFPLTVGGVVGLPGEFLAVQAETGRARPFDTPG